MSGPLPERHRRLTALALATLCAATLSVPLRAHAVPLRFEPAAMVGITGLGEELTAIAVAGEWLGLAGERGVAFGRGPDPLRRVALRGGVNDLVFAPPNRQGLRALLAATTLGLVRISDRGVAESVPLGPGANGAVERLAIGAGFIAAATADGVFVSADTRRWQRPSLSAGGASVVALRALGDGAECWTVVAGVLWRIELGLGPGGDVAMKPHRVDAPVGSLTAPRDLSVDLPGIRVAVVGERSIDVLWESGRWDRIRPDLAPGAEAIRFARALGQLWLATDRGLSTAAGLGGPWVRVGGAVGNVAILDLAVQEAALYVATRRGVEVGRAGLVDVPATPWVGPRERAGEARTDPDVRSVHRAALDYLALRPARLDALRRGLARSGWLPIVDFRFTRDTGWSRTSDVDESVVSGNLHTLRDRDRDRSSDLEMQLSLTWDLPKTAYHPESIDVSREAREVIELRDDVLDEITQLYFERRRVMGELAMVADGPDATRLRRRADELAAGIDAWTGGWFSRAASPESP